MTRTAKQPVVVKSAFAAPIGDGDNVIGFPSWTRRAPPTSSAAIGRRRLRSCPLPVRLKHVESADLTNALVSLLDLLTNVPGTASNLPFVNARITAEGPPRRLDDTVAPATDRFAGRVAFGLPPLIRRNDTRAASAHAGSYRRERTRSLRRSGPLLRPSPTECVSQRRRSQPPAASRQPPESLHTYHQRQRETRIGIDPLIA